MIRSSTEHAVQLISNRLLARNALLNLFGRLAPLVVAIFAIPVLIKGLGVERFGVLSLAWMLIGYFSLFDLGIGRALTKMVAEKMGAGEDAKVPVLVWTSLFLMSILGLLGALFLGLLSPWLVYSILKIPEALQAESLHVFYLLALSLPVVITTAGLRGILEARQLFGLINYVRIPMGLFTYIGPILAVLFTHNLVIIVLVLAVGRLAAWAVFLALCLQTLPELRQNRSIHPREMGPILRFGGWLTVSNITSPLMEYLDRFLIGSLVSVAAVAYYVTPYDVITKLWIIPGSVAGVMFPAFSMTVVQDNRRTALLFSRAVKTILLILFPVALLIITFAGEGLALWLGEEFRKNSTFVLQCLTLGVFINSISHIPMTLIQGLGRPDLTTKLHFIELPFYLVGVWWMIGVMGIKGAALAWLVRVTVDTVVLFVLTRLSLPETNPYVKRMGWVSGACFALLTIAMLPMSITAGGVFLLIVFPTFAIVSWIFVLDAEERLILQRCLKDSRVFFRRANFQAFHKP